MAFEHDRRREERETDAHLLTHRMIRLMASHGDGGGVDSMGNKAEKEIRNGSFVLDDDAMTREIAAAARQ